MKETILRLWLQGRPAYWKGTDGKLYVSGVSLNGTIWFGRLNGELETGLTYTQALERLEKVVA